MKSVSFSKTSLVCSETNVCSLESWRWLVWLHPCEEKMGLLMLLLVVMAANSHLRGTTERNLVTKYHQVHYVMLHDFWRSVVHIEMLK